MTWLPAFLLTQLVEVPVYLVVLHRRWRAPSPTGLTATEPTTTRTPATPRWSRVAVVALASGITHPLLWFAYWPLTIDALGYALALAIGELLVVTAEAGWLVLHRVPARHALGASVIANGASLLVGAVFSYG